MGKDLLRKTVLKALMPYKARTVAFPERPDADEVNAPLFAEMRQAVCAVVDKPELVVVSQDADPPPADERIPRLRRILVEAPLTDDEGQTRVCRFAFGPQEFGPGGM